MSENENIDIDFILELKINTCTDHTKGICKIIIALFKPTDDWDIIEDGLFQKVKGGAQINLKDKYIINVNQEEVFIIETETAKTLSFSSPIDIQKLLQKIQELYNEIS
jgi:hypothetical protein